MKNKPIIIDCPACENQMSSNAEACPCCGEPKAPEPIGIGAAVVLALVFGFIVFNVVLYLN